MPWLMKCLISRSFSVAWKHLSETLPVRCFRDLTESNWLSMERTEHLQRIFDNLATVLLQLETLISDCFLRLSGQRGTGRPKVHLMAWVRKRSQVEKLRQQLRDLRSTITAQLAGINL
jgi:hypothetical protein